jgi:hypothetical protein
MKTAAQIANEVTEQFPVSWLTGFSLLKLGHEEGENDAVIRFTLEYSGVCQEIMTAKATEGTGKIRGRLRKLSLHEIAGYILREVAFRYVLDRFGEPAVLADANLFERAIRRLHPRAINSVQLEEFSRAIRMMVESSSRTRKSTK